jgi:cell division transport system permease protein
MTSQSKVPTNSKIAKTSMLNPMVLLRSLRTGLTGFWRNIWLSTAATLVMVVTLVILSITMLVASVSNFAIQNVQQRVDVSIYFNQTATADQMKQLQNQILALPQVASVNFISAEEGLEQFKQLHANDQVIQQSLAELSSNPIPATLQVKAKTLDEYDSIVQFASQDQFKPYISSINYQDNRDLIQRMSAILKNLRRGGIILAILFAFIAVLVIFNTIRLTIYNRREEVEIMRLVSWYIRWPFFIESMLYALIAVIITAAITFPLLHLIIPRINQYIGATNGSNYHFVGYWLLFLIELVVALVLGIVSSFIAIRRYLKI